ncbi:asparagine synthase (glutamine-hydrolyzing) [Desulfovibrio inopinatus]|uniref:asparagine synthase (glutamine-hydrolyzing) n=1 Tax=Desulfovibrio inopinatus TaxID=102109 RepID=UPI00041D3126|nr:asparagine synthase (glutamine-hydrolyzing) [Desulfovibrio inopinatus]
MCGICGIVTDRGPKALAPVYAMRDAMAHRGPDGSSVVERIDVRGTGAALGHRRLAVIDLVTGDQPMTNEDRSIWIVFNGEIYNFQELRQDLERCGHRFTSTSDTETILHLYEQEGVDCVHKLRGMFAFAIWDEREKRLFAARDPFGKKPFHYALAHSDFVFSSEIKGLLAHPDIDRRLNLEAIYHYLSLQYVPDDMSAFAGVRKLPAGCRLMVQSNTVTVEQYYNPSFEPKLTGKQDALIEQLREVITDAVGVRLVSDVPLGAHLSGGIDSSIVTALMAELGSGPVRTFSIGFREERFSELDRARHIANRFGTDHREFIVDRQDLFSRIDHLPRVFDEPLADPSAIACLVLAEETRRHVTVALNGDGGDEMFAGYQRYRLDPWANIYTKMPRWLTQRLVPWLVSRLPERADVPIEQNYSAGLKRLAQAAAGDRRASLLRWGSYFSETDKLRLFQSEALQQTGFPPTSTLLSDLFDAAEASTFLDKTLAVDQRSYLPGDLLVKSDRTAMAHSLEGRSPLLDIRVAEFASRLPVQYKTTRFAGKILLRKAFAHLLPKHIVNAGKQGFGLPVGLWLRTSLYAETKNRLLDGTFSRQFFHTSEIERLLEEHKSGLVDHGKRLYALLCLEMWYNTYFES